MLEGMGTGQGVEMVPDAETGYKRISNNVRDAETKGKRMSKYDWFNKAKRDIESGRSMYGASEDYKNLPGVESQAPKNERVYRSESADRYGIGQAELGNGLYTGSKETAGRTQKGDVITDGLHEYDVNPNAKILDSSSQEYSSIDSKASNDPSLKQLDGGAWQQRKAELITKYVQELGYDGVRRGTNQVVAMSDKALLPVSENAPTYNPQPKTTRGNFQEQVVEGKPSVKRVSELPKTLDEFDKSIGGTGDIERQLSDQKLNKEEVPELTARTGGDAKPTANIPDMLAKYTDTKNYTDQELDKGKNQRSGLIRKTTDFVGGKLSATGDGTVQRKIRRAEQYIFGKQVGQGKEIIKALQKYQGDATYTDAALLDIGKQAYGLLPDAQSRERVHAVLDPETSKLGQSISENNLTDNEKQATQMLRDIGESINDTSYRMKMISKKKWLENKDGKYIARMYNEVQEAPDVADLLELPDTKRLITGMYKSREQFNDHLRARILRDPIKLAVIRARQVRSNETLDNYYREADQMGFVSDGPKPGYVKVQHDTGVRSWNGRYVRQDVYENINGFKAMSNAVNGMNTMLDAYDGNPARRLRKQLLTIWNPVVRTGNVTSNYFFAYLNGVNPATYQKNKFWAKKAMKSGNDSLYAQAEKAGLIGNNLINSDKNLFNKDKDFMAGLDRESANGSNALKRAGTKTVELKDKVSKRYGEADDIAKLAALKSHVDRGMSINESIEKTRKGFQDYNRVGHMYDLAAKAPVFGNAFVRFQGDLYMNIMKNASIDHPIRVASLPLATLALGTALSALSGESPEDKKTREDRLGAPKMPFTNVSTEFQTPWGAVDVARYTPLYMRNLLTDTEGGKNKLADDLSRLLPFNVPGANTKSEWARSAASDPLIGPVISAITDTDWRGKSVKDPQGFRDGKELFPDDPLTKSDQWKNRGQFAARSYLPYPFNEVGDIAASMNQNLRTEQSKRGGKDDPSIADPTDTFGRTGYNTSGSKKSLAQSLARLGGIRAQEFNAEDAKKQRDNNTMFDFFGRVDKFKDSLDSVTKQQFDLKHKGSQTRTGIKQEFENDPWYKYKTAAELLQNPKLFDAEKGYAQMQNKYDGKPIDPIFNLPDDQRNIVLAKKLKMPGSKDEGFNTLYDQPWYQDFRNSQDTYYKDKGTYAKKMGWSEYKSDNPYPEAKPETREAMDHYFGLSSSSAKSSFKKTNPGAWQSITDQWAAQDVWTDKEREKLGIPAIARDDSSGGGGTGGGKKSGYAKSGKGRGGRKGGKGKAGGAGTYQVAKTTDISKKLQDIANSASTKGKSSVSTPRKHSAKLKKVRSA